MTVTLHKAPCAAPAPPRLLRSVQANWRSRRVRRLGRYLVTSLVATGASEATLLLVYGAHLLAASAAAVVASLVGTAPSYVMSRYWIWPEADRRRAAHQAFAFWMVAVASLGVSSVVTGVAAANAPGSHLAHLLVAGVAYVGTYGALWVLKFVVYQRYLFRLSLVPADGSRPDATGGRPDTA